MWLLFKSVNFLVILTSTYMWMTTFLPIMPLLALFDILLTACIGMLPIKITIDRTFGAALLAILGLTLWSIWIDDMASGILTFIQYYPALLLILLPRDYQRDLLASITKWYAIMLLGSLAIYFMTFIIKPPSFGVFNYLNYPPFTNYILYLQTTEDYGMITRFNAFFLEPGHQALVSTFLLMANAFDFRRNKYCYILLAGVLFSFSLAGYMLTATGWVLIWSDSIKKAAISIGMLAAFVGAVLMWNGGDNDIYELIIARLEYDEQKGIKGNNRVNHTTDFIFEKAEKQGYALTGMKGHANMTLIEGAGYKIYVLKYGWIGVILVVLFYLSVIPPKYNIRYTVIYLIVLSLCFAQRAYPFWYSWLLPYILGIYIARREDPEVDERVSGSLSIELKD